MARKKKIAKDKPKNELQAKLLAIVEDTDISTMFEELCAISLFNQVGALDRKYFIEEVVTFMSNNGYEIIKCTGSLPEIMKIDEFRVSLEANPYQLRLIA